MVAFLWHSQQKNSENCAEFLHVFNTETFGRKMCKECSMPNALLQYFAYKHDANFNINANHFDGVHIQNSSRFPIIYKKKKNKTSKEKIRQQK